PWPPLASPPSGLLFLGSIPSDEPGLSQGVKSTLSTACLSQCREECGHYLTRKAYLVVPAACCKVPLHDQRECSTCEFQPEGTFLLLHRAWPSQRSSICAQLPGLSVLAIPLIRTWFGHLDWVYDYLTETPGKIAICLHTAVTNGLLLIIYRGPLYKVAVRACFLGVTFGCGLIISFSETTWTHFGWYMCSLSLFHYSEYLVTAIINPHSLSLDSFLLNHSVEYTLAAISSWVEFTVEKLTVPELKQLKWVSLLGLLMVLCGDILRKAAMLTAGSNFNHIVQNEKARSHVLVTGGVYSFFRHPSYVGWFYWCTGTQVRYRSTLHLDFTPFTTSTYTPSQLYPLRGHGEGGT
uniref:Protein-S-isoprenylcysteine O-methyltransferase n=1 Tax=Takifugu rubripes TaxID=31033 RepID=A0A674P1S0_TAKRU